MLADIVLEIAGEVDSESELLAVASMVETLVMTGRGSTAEHQH